jgi:hypothetical protein
MHNEEQHDLSSTNIRAIQSRKMRLVGGGGGGKSTGENRNAYKVLMGKPEGKRPVERTRRGWKYIKMDIKEPRL